MNKIEVYHKSYDINLDNKDNVTQIDDIIDFYIKIKEQITSDGSIRHWISFWNDEIYTYRLETDEEYTERLNKKHNTGYDIHNKTISEMINIYNIINEEYPEPDNQIIIESNGDIYIQMQ